jgi:hypothetical protein
MKANGVVKHGFVVSPHTRVIIDERFPPPREEVVDVVRNIWNTDKSIQQMRDYINEIRIDVRGLNDTNQYIGEWYKDYRFHIYDNITMDPHYYETVTIHELDGHAYFQWSMIYRTKLLEAFCKLANICPPVTSYVKKYEDKWRKIPMGINNDFNYYTDEQHSALAEIDHEIENCGIPYHEILISDKLRDQLLHLYRELHELRTN